MAQKSDKLLAKLNEAVDGIGERIEVSRNYSELFADANILGTVAPVKNQVIRGRRGTGKTHLLGRLNAYYRENYAKLRVLSVFLDGRKICAELPMEGSNPVLTVLIWYRRFLDMLVESLGDFARDKIVLTNFDRIWPSTEKKRRLKSIRTHLGELQALVRFGDVQIGPGQAHSEVERARSQEGRGGLTVDARLATTLKKLAETKASFGAEFKRANLSNAGQRLKVVYEGLTVLDYIRITETLQSVIDLVKADAFVLLFDEWSALELTHQPIFAQMVRTTLIGGRQFAIKVGCIPFLTRLSETDENGQPIGFPIGEEVFVGVDLDRLYDPYANSEEVTGFLLAVLQKHLSHTIHEFRVLKLNDWVGYCSTTLFEDDAAIKEIVQASAGVPRDFLRLFARAFRASRRTGAIGSIAVRIATHEFFQQEKRSLIEGLPKANALYEEIFNGICLRNNTCFFFVSQSLATERCIQELWHNRLLHLLFQGHVAFAGEKQGTYDIYVMDYGRFALMRNTKRGEQAYFHVEAAMEFLLRRVLSMGEPAKTLLKVANLDQLMKARFARFAATMSPPVSSDLATMLEDCSAYLADELVSKYINRTWPGPGK